MLGRALSAAGGGVAEHRCDSWACILSAVGTLQEVVACARDADATGHEQAAAEGAGRVVELGLGQVPGSSRFESGEVRGLRIYTQYVLQTGSVLTMCPQCVE